MEKDIVLKEFDALLEEGENVLATKYHYNSWDYVEDTKISIWKTRILSFLGMFLESDNASIVKIQNMREEDYAEAVTCLGIVKSIKDHVEKGLIAFEEKKEINVDETLDRVFARFHRVARQLRSRHGGRDTLDINDEYDVQDLLHALLQLYFDDIRDEEWTPSYAGSAARVDFLLKNEKTVIEVKKTRQGLADKEVGNQLIEDIERYKVHPDCEKLICFVYDPEGRIGNPNGVMNDLNSRPEGFAKVVIQPNI